MWDVEFINADAFFLSSMRDSRLTEYRRRFLRRYPDFATQKYLDHPQMKHLDGVPVGERINKENLSFDEDPDRKVHTFYGDE